MRSRVVRETNLGSFGVGDSLVVNPVRRLRVLGVVDLLGRVDGGLEVLEEAAGLLADTVEENLVGVVGSACKLSTALGVYAKKTYWIMRV
jgi:hypothetical protein